MQNRQTESELLTKTKELVENRPRTVTYAVINEETGLPIQFLQDLMANRLKDPGVRRIEILYKYFTKQKSIIAA